MFPAVNSAVFGFAEIKSIYSLHAASDEKEQMASGTAFLYFSGDGFVYALRDSGHQPALYAKDLSGKCMEQNGSSFGLFQDGKGFVDSFYGKGDGKHYSLFLQLADYDTACLLLYVQMKIVKKAAIGAGLFYSLFGFLLDPEILAKILRKEEYEMFLVRRMIGWISPLNHATYGMHDFGYDVLPSIQQSCVFFLVILALLSGLSFHTLKQYNFSSFTGE